MYLVNAVIFIEKAHPSRAVLRAVSLLQRGGAFITGFWVIATGITGMILPGTPFCKCTSFSYVLLGR
jgi:hypothetical protein